MELQAVMEKRRSIRNYNSERKVTKEQLDELIKAASYAPSWKNLQTSRYYCVLSENAVKELRENIPDSENVVSVIAVGYRGQEPPERPKRKELDAVAKFI
jgi:nitroreductase